MSELQTESGYAPASTYPVSIVKPITEKYEGLRLNAYLCPAGVWTVGYGHTKGVHSGLRIDKATADQYLTSDLEDAKFDVCRLVKVPLTSGQFIALVDFVFNVGASQFASSTLLRKLNLGDHQGAGEQFNRWIYGGGKVLPGLVARRASETSYWFDNKPDFQ